ENRDMDIDPEVGRFIDAVPNLRRRRDAERLLEMMGRVTGQPARLLGSVIGFGSYHYRYASGREGDAPAAGFAPRKAATTVYLMNGVNAEPALIAGLGPHKAGVGCLYLTDLDHNDLAVLEQLIARSY